MLLLTTPDYLPKLGGLSSHTLNVEKVLKGLNIPYELFHWKSYQDIYRFPQKRLDKFDYVINIHSGFHMYAPPIKGRVINFINGAEILFYSPNFLKNTIKQMTKRSSLRRVESAYFNFFISEFTFNTMIKKGLKANYSRDLIVPMSVDTSVHQMKLKNWDSDILKLICVARDVPHKNFNGVIKFCEIIQSFLRRNVELITVTNKKFFSEKIKITSHINPSNDIRDQLLASAHINLLLSLDHSQKGFFEGFGQIVQEAGCFATPSLVLRTGGLPESVHHNYTGWVIDQIEEEEVKNWASLMSNEVYQKISKECYVHTLDSHGLTSWERVFRKTLNL